jgi:hemoglobin/transferrin/lactoferrin receptor protein
MLDPKIIFLEFYNQMKNLFLVAMFFALSTISFAQSSVSGIVKDQNDAVIAGAKVTLRNISPNQKNVALTNQNGEFSFQTVVLGSYELVVSANGFSSNSQSFSISANESKKIDISLEIGKSNLSVTAEIGIEVDKDKVPQAVNLISKEEISQRTTAVLGQAVDEEVGVAFQRTSPTLGGVFIRGLAGKNVNVFVDGVRYTNSAQRGGINSFFNLNEPTNLQTVEIIRGPSAAQYGSDSLGGTISLLTRNANTDGKLHGDVSTSFNSADRSFGSQAFLSFGTDKFGGYGNIAERRVNNLRTAQGIESHAAVTRFLGLSSKILGERLPDTSFTQYGGAIRLNYAPTFDNQFVFYYQRNQQDGGKRWDQLQGGDGNLIADLRNLQGDFGYIRYNKQNAGIFDNANFAVSYNAQREERVNQGGQGNPFAAITHQYEKTKAIGGNFFFDKQIKQANFLIGGDYYNERITSPAFTVDPVLNRSTLSRPRIPNQARFRHGGLFVQNSVELFNEKIRVSGAIRYGVASYRARQSDSPLVLGQPLWRDDSWRDGDWSGRIGAVGRLTNHLKLAFNYSRGFRYPSMTDFGTLGLTGDGFEIDYTSAIVLGGLVGTTAGSDAVSTGLAVSKQRSELSNNIDFSVRWSHKRIETDFTVFRLDINESITKQALILPAGSVGRQLGDQIITSQLANGVVFVPLSTAPVLVRANFSDAKLYGFEYELDANITNYLKFRGNYTYVKSQDKVSGLPPNIEGGTPPPTGFVSFKFTQPRFWIEAFSTIADRQDRLSSLDISDRRTGATRSRAQIQNYFRRGACVLGLTNNPGTCGTAGTTTLLSTGETLTQVQNRVLGVGVNSAPLLTYLPGYGLVNLRGSFNLTKKASVFLAFENIFDKIYRNPSWGIDGSGRTITMQVRYKF